ncbi:MAG: hypothetical protein BGP01_11095 [Paludibacter sp. 47-17]|nr:MAG: hypothetical protein ABS72_01290 [Paludibacter sp. SCN 50-10]OJX90942.1 MAG: hypothetical protein BGP01_11095 [Paludibacter sp. 47-17]
MKQFFTFLAMMLLTGIVVKGQQLQTFVLDDFENGQVNFTEVVNVNPPAHMDIAVVDNPVKSGINTSSKVWEWRRFDAETDNKIWAGFYSVLKNEIPSGYHRIEIKYLRTNTTSQIKIKPEGGVSKEIAAETPASKTNEWELMVFDIYKAGIKNIRVFGFFPDFYEPINPNAVVYVDDITIVYDPSVIPPPPPTSITLFDNSASDRFHDNSWSFKEGGSTLVQEHWQGPDMPDGDKVPAVTTPVKSAPNALKLQWKSVEGGNWGAIVASKDWVPHDVRTMTNFHLWVNSPVDLSGTALPMLYFEATTGSPNKTGKLNMGAYVQNLAANTWAEVVIPLADFWAADPTFTSQEFIKGVFFGQNAADNAEHSLYLDDIGFKKDVNPDPVKLFANSANNRFHDQSWSFKEGGSTLVQEHWQAADMPDGDKLPADTLTVKSAPNSLKLQWKSAEGGNWAALVASVGWTAHDITAMTHVQLWLNSPAELAGNALPEIYLESHSGNPNKTGKVALGNYIGKLEANVWTAVKVPLADLYESSPSFVAKDVVKGIFFEQGIADNVEHTVYVDEISFVYAAKPADVLLDFGPAATGSEGNWNNIAGHQDGKASLIDAYGNATGVMLKVTDPFYNGFNSSGTSAPTGDAAQFPASATSDNFFGNGAQWGTTPANPAGVITFSGLDASKAYSFVIFASRTGVTNIRDARYTFAGSGEAKSAVLNASNNVSNVAVVNEVKPTTEGVITFTTEAGPDNNSAEKFYFLGALKMSAAGGQTSVTNPLAGRLTASYSNGVLRTGDYTGRVRVYGISGNQVADVQSVFGYATLQLQKGVYVVSTSLGNVKIAVY